MAVVKPKTSRISIKKKKWIKITAPKFLEERVIGESFLSEPAEAIKRTVKVNLMQVTGDIKSQNIAVKFQIADFKDNKLQTKIDSYEYLPSSVKRLMRRSITRIDESFVVSTKDGVKIRIKPLLITREKVSRSVEKKLRAELKAELVKFVTGVSYEELYTEIIQNKIQNDLKKKFNVIYPLKGIIIRVVEKEPDEYVSKKAQEKALAEEPKAEDIEAGIPKTEETPAEAKEEKPKKKAAAKKPAVKKEPKAKAAKKKE